MKLTPNTYCLLDDDLNICLLFKTDYLDQIADEWYTFETLLLETSND